MEAEMSIAGQVAFLAIQLGVIIFAARFCGRLAQKIHVPPVLGELLAGIIIGPFLLGSMNLSFLGFAHGIFPLLTGSAIPISLPLYALATLGSIVLLFMSGLETDLRMFFRYSVAGTVVGLGGVIFSFAFGAGLGMVMLHTGFMDPRCLFLGILCTATSVGITARILSEKKSIDSPEGTTILAAAVIDDVLGIICLAVVMGIIGVSAGGGVNWLNIELIALKSVGIWLGVTALGLLLAHRIAKFLKIFHPSATFSILALGLALLLSGIFEEAGLAMIVGAYVMGLSLSKTDIAFSVQRSLRGVYDFLVPIFFVVMGMLVDVRVLADPEVLKFGLIYSVLAVLAKIIGCALPAYFMNFNMLGSLRIGMGMIPRGEVALIIAGIGATTMMKLNGVDVPIIDAKLFGVAIIMTLATTLLAPPLLAMILAVKGKGVRKEVHDATLFHTAYNFPSDTIRDLVIRMLVDNLRSEGFRHSEFDKEAGILHFRNEAKTFTMRMEGNEVDFESSAAEVTLIKTVMYEIFVELHRNMADLKEVAQPEKFGKIIDALPGDAAYFTAVSPEKIIPAACILTDLHAISHADAIEKLLLALNKTGAINDLDQCRSDVLAREATVSTCLSGGTALPHAKTDGVNKLTAAIGICRNGYWEFEKSGESVRLVVLSLSPKQAEKPYLQFLSQVAGCLAAAGNVDKICDCSTPEEVLAIFSGSRKNGGRK